MRRERLMRVMDEFHAGENTKQTPEYWRGPTGLWTRCLREVELDGSLREGGWGAPSYQTYW